MRYTLKDYQTDAVRGVLDNLRKARRYYRQEGDRSQFSLSATTGAGKTVIAAAVIEALFFGSDEFGFEPDPGAVVVWFSDAPSLNDQSRARLQAASDQLDGRLVPVPSTFSRPKFEPRTVYFLNTQKFSRTSRLVRGAAIDDEQTLLVDARPDDLQSSIWDTITTTIQDEDLTFYFVLDEAHRGMGPASNDHTTIVQRLINGQGIVPPLPIVWGISATVERFERAMRGMTGRVALPPVDVDSARVQASGLLKDTIVLDIPDESGRFDTVLLRRAVQKVVASTAAWDEYARAQGDAEPVVPLLVVQVPDRASGQMLAEYLETIYSAWPDLDVGAFANVFGEHETLQIGRTTIEYIEPERVQDARHVRVLFAKTAISTGWDCPRAEVLVSFRPAVDATSITQLLGRMVRSPLARRISGDDVLNSVNCLLPYFNRATATAVVTRLTTGSRDRDDEENVTGSGGGEGRRVLFNPIEMTPNPAVPESVWKRYLELPSETLPRKLARPIPRLTALAQALSDDGLVDGAGILAHERLHAILDGQTVQYRARIDQAIENIRTANGQEIRAPMGGIISYGTFTEAADSRMIEDAYRAARLAFSNDLARTYTEHLAGLDWDDDAMIDAHVRIASLALVPEIVQAVEDEAVRLAADWFARTRVERMSLPDGRQAVYDELEAMSTEPQRIYLTEPRVRQEETRMRDAQGNETLLPTCALHLLADADGAFPVSLNDWESRVLETETTRPDFLAWYRNPGRAGKDSLVVAYQDGRGDHRSLCPDFIFFRKKGDGTVVADIVDPHGYQFADALPKLRGLARFAETYGSDFGRIDAIAEVDGTLKVLDLTRQAVRDAVKASGDAASLYTSTSARDYY
ncbi:MAG TPA: DEAD/DEAH box helicase family protein [Methanoregulaceae archaeon]|nr:DEAD/DEAH box helicase family protein [Methanoregulaceae archaeon]